MKPTFYRRLEVAEKSTNFIPLPSQVAARERTRVFFEAARDCPATKELIDTFVLRIVFHTRNDFREMTWEDGKFAGVTDSELWQRTCERLADARKAEGLPPLEPPPEFGDIAARADEAMARIKRDG